MSITNLGKRLHKVKRMNTQGGWVDGEWVNGDIEIVEIFANIQPAFGFHLTQLLDVGDRSKQAIWGSSNHWVNAAETSGDQTRQGDLILYRGSEWEVKAIMPYGNFGEHCEFIAVKVHNKDTVHQEGLVEVIN